MTFGLFRGRLGSRACGPQGQAWALCSALQYAPPATKLPLEEQIWVQFRLFLLLCVGETTAQWWRRPPLSVCGLGASP